MSPPPSHRLGINALPEHSPQVIHPSAQKRNSANVAKNTRPYYGPSQIMPSGAMGQTELRLHGVLGNSLLGMLRSVGHSGSFEGGGYFL
jgi:hypothetical protein